MPQHLLLKILKQAKKFAIEHRHCFLCHQYSRTLICECCMTDTALPHFDVAGFDLMYMPSIKSNLVLPYYHHLYALGRYEGLLQKLITQLKFHQQTLAAEVLARFFIEVVYQRLSQLEDGPDAILPIPLSLWRYAKRNYNQAQLIADAISELSGLPVIAPLQRTKHTRAQTKLDREQRLQNTHGAFILTSEINYQHIAVIDDVITTGATVNSACQAIVESYPDITVSVWTMAVAPAK